MLDLKHIYQNILEEHMLEEAYSISDSNSLWLRACRAESTAHHASSDNTTDSDNDISETRPLYLTLDFDYAYYYTQLPKTSKTRIAVYKLKNCEVCHLYHAADYTRISKKTDFPEEMAEIFKHIDVYFSFNTKVPPHPTEQAKIPPEYVEARNFILQNNPGVKNIAAAIKNPEYKACGQLYNEPGKRLVKGYIEAIDAASKIYQSEGFPKYVSNKFVDILRYIFFKTLKDTLGYKGYYCPENTRVSHAISTRSKHDDYYFGESGHTHPVLALFDKSVIAEVKEYDANVFYYALGTILDDDVQLLDYSRRAELLDAVAQKCDSMSERAKENAIIQAPRMMRTIKNRLRQHHAERVPGVNDEDGNPMYFKNKEKKTRDQNVDDGVLSRR